MDDRDGSEPSHDAPGTVPGGDDGDAVESEGDAGTDPADGADAERTERGVAPDDGREWEFSLQDIQQREADAEAEARAAERRREPLEAGDPSMEGVFFVLLGVVLTLFILSRLVVG